MAGVDGCRGGWLLALVTGSDPATARIKVSVEVTFAAVVERCRAAQALALGVDIPLGFAVDGVRDGEVEGRRRLGHRRSTLFPSPAHAALEADDWDEALALNRAAAGKGLSKQAFHLLAKSREVRSVISPADQPWCSEVHPELSFAAMAGCPQESKKAAAGVAARLTLIEANVGSIDPTPAPKGARADDVLDGCAAAWTAGRLSRGEAEWMGSGCDPDGYALALAI